MDKRTFLKSLGAGLALALPGASALGGVFGAQPQTPLPFNLARELIGVQPITEATGTVFYLKMLETAAAQSVREMTLSITKANVTKESSVDVLDALLDHAIEFERISTEPEKLIFDVNRAAIDIASKTRRGRGNTLLVHPQNFSLVSDLDPRYTVLQHADQRLLGVILVGYRSRSQIDSSMFSITERDGDNSLFVAEDVPSYFRLVKI